MFNSILSLYKNVRSCVKYKNNFSDFFKVEQGVLQGEALSPLLFSLYLNDFENAFIRSNCQDISLQEVSLFLMLYADDMVLFSDSPEGLQKMLDVLYSYCNDWKLSVNVSKTKIVVFRKSGRLNPNIKWFYNDEEVEAVNQFTYLGLTLTYTGNFHKAQLKLASQGRKCMFKLLKSMKNVHFNYVTRLSLFDTYVSSILNYASEIWGFHKGDAIEKIHLEYLKIMLKVRKNTSSLMIYNELGRLPLFIQRKVCTKCAL